MIIRALFRRLIEMTVSLVHSRVIEGDLNITGNNTTIAECDVYGTVSISGLNTVLVRDRFAGTSSIPGKNLTCNGNVRFDDANGDHVVDAAEIGGPVTCGS